MEGVVQAVLLSLIYPAIWSILVLGWAWRPALKPDIPEASRREWAAPLALAVGYMLAHYHTLGWPVIPPTESTQWLFFLAPLGGLLGILEARWQSPRWWQGLSRLLLLLGNLWLALRPMVGETLTLGSALVWLVALSLLGGLTWYGLEALARRRSGASMPLHLSLWAAGTGMALALSHSAALGQLAGGLALTVGMAVLVAWRNTHFSLAGGALAVFWPLLLALGVNGYFYASLSPWVALLLWASPLGLVAGWWAGSWRGWLRTLLSTAISGLFWAVALWIAYANSASPLDYY